MAQERQPFQAGRRVSASRTLLLVGLLTLQACATRPAIDDEVFVRALLGADLVTLENLLQQADAPVNLTTPDGRNALMIVAGAGRLDLVGQLLDRGLAAGQSNHRGGTALMYAAVSGERAVVRRLLDAGAEVNAVARNGWTAITLAAAKGHVDVLRELLDAGADPNIPDMYGWTPLMRAVEQKHPPAVALLLDVPGIVIDAVNDNGATALFRATVTGQADVVRLLLERGADPWLADFEGRTPIVAAEQINRPDLIDLMRTRRAN